MATWYAQLAATDVSAANQWNAAPDSSGAWLTWENLQPTDVLCANGKTDLYISSGFTCGSITTSGGGIGADGGKFLNSSDATSKTLTCNIVAGTTTCLMMASMPWGQVFTIIGDITGGSAVNAIGVDNWTGRASIAITGTVTGGSATNARGFHSNGAGSVITIIGNATGGSAAGAIGALFDGGMGTGYGTVTGNVTGGSNRTAYGILNSAAPCTVIGSLVDSATCSAAAGKIYWRPASVAHYWQVAWDGSYNFRYTLPPMAQNVREGVQRGYMLESPDNGTLRIPAEADVKLGVGYGGGGTEYTGTLVAGGGGVPLIGPGGLVG